MSLCNMCQKELADEVRLIGDTPYCVNCWENLKCENCGDYIDDEDKVEELNGWCGWCSGNEAMGARYG